MTRPELVAEFLRAREVVEVLEAEARDLKERERLAKMRARDAEAALLEELTGGDLHAGTARREVSIVVPIDDAGAALLIQTQTGWSSLLVTGATLEPIVGRRVGVVR